MVFSQQILPSKASSQLQVITLYKHSVILLFYCLQVITLYKHSVILLFYCLQVITLYKHSVILLFYCSHSVSAKNILMN
jgi:uncharacterized membrane protein